MTETAGREGGTCLSWKNEWRIISRHFEPIILGRLVIILASMPFCSGRDTSRGPFGEPSPSMMNSTAPTPIPDDYHKAHAMAPMFLGVLNL